MTVQVRRTRPSDPAVAVRIAEPTIPGPLRVAVTVVPTWTCMVMFTSLSPPGWAGSKERVGVGFEDAPVGVLVGDVDVGVRVAIGVLVGIRTVGVGVRDEARTGVGTVDLPAPPTGVLVGVGIIFRVTNTTRVGVGRKNGVGVNTGVGIAVTTALVEATKRVGVVWTIRNAVGVANSVVVTVGICVRVGPAGVRVGKVGSGSSDVPQAMAAISTAARSAISAKGFVTSFAPSVMAPGAWAADWASVWEEYLYGKLRSKGLPRI